MTDAIDQTYAGRSVLVTGHTGFKGSWLSLWLAQMGARVTGFSNTIPTSPSAYEIMELGARMRDLRGEISDRDALVAAMAAAEPSIVFHLAAQAIVRRGFNDPFGTFQTNVMGTAAVLDAACRVPSVRAVVIVTSDKVYDNNGSVWPFRETDPLGGHEPYGASKAAAEIVATTWRSAGFHKAAGSVNTPHVVTARAGNVIGGGDWAADRLLPDFVRAIAEQRDQEIRQPRATRPWQHVLEPVGGYLLLGSRLLQSPEAVPAATNFGPLEPVMPDVEQVARKFLEQMKASATKLKVAENPHSGEAHALRVDSSLAIARLGWRPAWTAVQAISRAGEWYRAHLEGEADMVSLSQRQLAEYRSETPVAALRS
ncbi:CDP-glucose 4,6-dehydratase [Ruegeria marina]|uniref:CDP-glucose 4,6-dehydratase n=1 Tax=Ruegeria marina TaxID=639004 RepID=A0A1G6VLP6_9RHOB|nr:CDP-glucose 4,6-dehydratase [Ruegeria marina]SDD53937.1 CDP-glucose 4,6-dehydratase [Ruegeria marina]